MSCVMALCGSDLCKKTVLCYGAVWFWPVQEHCAVLWRCVVLTCARTLCCVMALCGSDLCKNTVLCYGAVWFWPVQEHSALSQMTRPSMKDAKGNFVWKSYQTAFECNSPCMHFSALLVRFSCANSRLSVRKRRNPPRSWVPSRKTPHPRRPCHWDCHLPHLHDIFWYNTAVLSWSQEQRKIHNKFQTPSVNHSTCVSYVQKM